MSAISSNFVVVAKQNSSFSILRRVEKQFLMDNPNKILLIGAKDNEINLACGEQKPARTIELGFAASPDGSGVAGMVRSLDFTK